MKIYRVKPRFNGTLNKDFNRPEDAIKYFYEHTSVVCGKMYGTVQEKIEELVWIGKMEVIEGLEKK